MTSAIDPWQIISTVMTLLLGTYFGNIVASKKVKNDDKHQIIDSLQEQLQTEREERRFIQKQIDELYKYVRKLEADHSELAHENRKFEWKLEIKEDEIKQKDKTIDRQSKTIERLKQALKERGVDVGTIIE